MAFRYRHAAMFGILLMLFSNISQSLQLDSSFQLLPEPACKRTDPGAIIHNASLEKAFPAHVLFVVDECSDEGLVNPRLIQKITKGLSAALLGKGYLRTYFSLVTYGRQSNGIGSFLVFAGDSISTYAYPFMQAVKRVVVGGCQSSAGAQHALQDALETVEMEAQFRARILVVLSAAKETSSSSPDLISVAEVLQRGNWHANFITDSGNREVDYYADLSRKVGGTTVPLSSIRLGLVNKFALTNRLMVPIPPASQVQFNVCRVCRCSDDPLYWQTPDGIGLAECKIAVDQAACKCSATGGLWYTPGRVCYDARSLAYRTTSDCTQFLEPWTGWSECSASCGSGFRFQTRLPSAEAALLPEGHACSGIEAVVMTEHCNSISCPAHQHNMSCQELASLYGEWTSYAPCSVPCGSGVVFGTNIIPQKYLRPGQICGPQGSWGTSCPLRACPSNFTCDEIFSRQGHWGSWSDCSATCGEGYKRRTRLVHVADLPIDQECPSQVQIQRCFGPPCPSPLEHCLDGTTTFLYQAPVRSTQAANVIVILDDSSGMAMLGGWPFYNLVNMEDALLHRGFGVDAGNPNYYSVIGFGSSRGGQPYVLSASNGMVFFPASFFPTLPHLVSSGNTADGYGAMLFALEQLAELGSLSPNRRTVMVIVTGEARQADDIQQASLTKARLAALMRRHGIIPHVVVAQSFACGSNTNLSGIGPFQHGFTRGHKVCNVPASLGSGYSTTTVDYSDLALQLGGSVWNIGHHRTSRDEFYLHLAASVRAAHVSACYVCPCQFGRLECSPLWHHPACSCAAYEWQWNGTHCETSRDLARRECSSLYNQYSSWRDVSGCLGECGHGEQVLTMALPSDIFLKRQDCPPLIRTRSCFVDGCEQP